MTVRKLYQLIPILQTAHTPTITAVLIVKPLLKLAVQCTTDGTVEVEQPNIADNTTKISFSLFLPKDSTSPICKQLTY